MTEQSSLGPIQSKDSEARRRAVAALVDASGPGKIELLFEALGDDDWRVRKEAVAVAVRCAPDPDVLDALISAIGSDDNVGRHNAAVEALSEFGEAAVERLSTTLSRVGPDARKLAVEALGRSGRTSAIGALSALLADPDANVRIAVIEALGTVGASTADRVAPQLSQAFRSGKGLERTAALDAINDLGIVLDWDHLAPHFEDPSLRRAALAAAGRIPDLRIGRVLVNAVVSDDQLVSDVATLALAEYLTLSQDTLDATRRDLQRATPAERRRMLDDLGDLGGASAEVGRARLLVVAAIGGKEALDAILDVADRDDLAGNAEQAITLLGDDIGEFLVARLTSKARPGRILALQTLRDLGHQASEAHALWIARDMLAESDESALLMALEVLEEIGDEEALLLLAKRFAEFPEVVQFAAANALRAMTRRHGDCALKIVRAAREDPNRILVAIFILGELATSAPATGGEYVDYLVAALHHDVPTVRCAALSALGRMGESASVDVIAFALADEDEAVRLAAIEALGELRSDGGKAPGADRIIELIDSGKDNQGVVAAIHALGQTGDPRTLSVVGRLLRCDDAELAVAAIEVIGDSTDSRRIEVLIDSLSHPDPEVLKVALNVLAEIGGPRAQSHLAASLDHVSWDVRRLAADLLGIHGGQFAVGPLRARLAVETEPLVREALYRTLSDLDASSSSRRESLLPRTRG